MVLSKQVRHLGWRLIDNLPYAYRAALVHWCLQVSTYRARKNLIGCNSLKILVDNSVLGHGRTHETVSIMQRVNWPPGHEPSELPVVRRVPIDIKGRYGKEIHKNVQYLAGIAHLSRIGLVDLMTSFELLSERDHQPMGRFLGKVGWFDYWLFSDTEIKSVDGYGSCHFGFDQFQENPTINRVIYASDIDPLGLYPNNKENQIKRITNSNDPLYLSLANVLPKKCNLDAWHIRTAEIHNVFCFLTMDMKLRRIIEEKQTMEPIASLRTKIMTPKELGEYIGIVPIFPHIYELKESDAMKYSRQ